MMARVGVFRRVMGSNSEGCILCAGGERMMYVELLFLARE